jgi:hypothetical protein
MLTQESVEFMASFFIESYAYVEGTAIAFVIAIDLVFTIPEVYAQGRRDAMFIGKADEIHPSRSAVDIRKCELAVTILHSEA